MTRTKQEITRANFQLEDDNTLTVCWGDHEKSQSCIWDLLTGADLYEVINTIRAPWSAISHDSSDPRIKFLQERDKKASDYQAAIEKTIRSVGCCIIKGIGWCDVLTEKTTLKDTDWYWSTSGEWQICPCPGVELEPGLQSLWVRPRNE